MGKLNTGGRPVSRSRKPSNVMMTVPVADGRTHNRAAGFSRDPKTELFMRATTVFAGEGQFYEDAAAADARAVELARQVAVQDWKWVFQFLIWLRSQGNIRTSALMLTAQAVEARVAAGFSYAMVDGRHADPRRLVDAVLQRADEPGELLQYCLNTFGRVPQPVRKGIADAVLRLWGERAVIRWDKDNRPMRFADVIEYCHPRPWTKPDGDQPRQPRCKAPEGILGTIPAETRAQMTKDDVFAWLDTWERDLSYRREVLFRYLLDTRHHPSGAAVPEDLPMIAARRALSVMTPGERHMFAGRALDRRDGRENRMLRDACAGQWEWSQSWLGEGLKGLPGGTFEDGTVPLTDRQRWELVIPWMGYMALLRNLRNFEDNGVRRSIVNKICQRIADPAEVAASRQLPYRFLSAWLNTKSIYWKPALEDALHHSMPNIPKMSSPGLILVDLSGSMDNIMGTDSAHRNRLLRDGKTPPVYPTRMQAALVFALGLAVANPGVADVYGFAVGNMAILVDQATQVLPAIERVNSERSKVGQGTQVTRNLKETFNPSRHRWVAVITDEQTSAEAPGYELRRADYFGYRGVSQVIPAHVPLFSWNLAGLTHGMFPTGDNRYALAGLTDHSFAVMDRIMSGRDGVWPWDLPPARRPADDDDDE